MKIYDLVKQLLTDYPELRDSDKKLIWEVWDQLELVDEFGFQHITYDNFMKAPSTESIRRARQLIQARHPELQATKRVRSYRHQKEESKGTFAYREEVSFSESVKEQMTFI